MAKKELHEYTLEELQSKAKGQKTVTSILIGLIIALFGVSLYGLFARGDSGGTMVIGFALLSIVLLNFQQLKKINEEIAKRVDG
ncbi:MAG: hypothetical protein AAF798_03585 [Bacteroidota bacterium]